MNYILKNSYMNKISYALGMNLAQNLKASGIETIEYAEFTKGLEAAFEGKETQMSADEANQTLQQFFGELQAKQAEAAIQAGKDFLAENTKKEGVVTLESGLQYEVITEGDGAKPSAADQVECHYHGTLIDGTVFDSSVQRGEPATFPVSGVIQGWVEALQLMPVGSKWRLYIPSNLAYGERGAGQHIGPHTTLVFEVELLAIK
ncbi:FKBP-type peptidyl-prolyl cis-trans isomerase [Carboxylicivirga sediminis]|uniref:Peptidyl-prolyl cis-trans isomerase n=2 Tax=Carboxylicivirga sediminis TaxID=2006564 RepID=A0A941F529_9BACT|nr:FKBP-type peptidyl-prolyl cis-trans isomerase [Carboxylicivirga sediminis]MBR8536966.1 FKBP-type peptidyl-prolyl cis-trans isomerase [Carboxylicivirga sediminis]